MKIRAVEPQGANPTLPGPFWFTCPAHKALLTEFPENKEPWCQQGQTWGSCTGPGDPQRARLAWLGGARVWHVTHLWGADTVWGQELQGEVVEYSSSLRLDALGEGPLSQLIRNR